MNVGQLKKLLENTPDEAEIYFQMREGCCGDFRELDLEDGEPRVEDYTQLYKKPDPSKCHHAVYFEFDSLPGYRSCIQAGGTIQRDKEYWEKFKPELLKKDKKHVDET